MNILLTGLEGVRNRGCEAILRSTIFMLRKEFPGVKITVSSFDYLADSNADFGSDIKFIPAQFKRVWERWTFPWMIRQFCRMIAPRTARYLEHLPKFSAIRKADAVLSIGGDNFTMDYGYPGYFLDETQLARRYKRKYVIWGASIGPFPQDENLPGIIECLRSADLITVREPVTFDYLSSLGLNNNLKRVVDPAFILPLEKAEHGCNIPSGAKGILGFNMSPLISRFSGKADDIFIIDETAGFLRELIDTYKLYMLFIPHVIRPDCPEHDDYSFMQKIYGRLADTGMVGQVSPEFNAQQLKYIISQCRFFIGARTHATIAALSTGVPTLSIGYSPKSRGINQDLFGHLDYLLNINELDRASLMKKFQNLMQNENKIREKLISESGPIKGKAWDNARFLRELISQ